MGLCRDSGIRVQIIETKGQDRLYGSGRRDLPVAGLAKGEFL
jgi:hypothetical protein